LKDNQLRPRVSRLYINLDPDTFEIRYDNTNINYLIKHNLETLIPKCSIICTIDEYYEDLLSNVTVDQRKYGIEFLDFTKKKLDNAYKMVGRYDDLAQKKLLTKGANSCGIISFEDIGTYVQ